MRAGAGAEAAACFSRCEHQRHHDDHDAADPFLSEIIPKTIGAVYWRRLASITARFVKTLIYSLFPLIWVSEQLTKLLTKGKSLHGFNREEFTALADVGAASGQFDKRESNILTNLFRFPELRVRDIMTPRTVVFALRKIRRWRRFWTGSELDVFADSNLRRDP